MQYDLIDYVPDQNVFYFHTGSPHVGRIYGVSRMAAKNGGFIWVFPGAYPDGYLALKDFKAFIGGKATPRAIERINYLKDVPEMIKNNSLIGSLGLDFKRNPFPHQLEVAEAMLHYNRLAVLLEQGMGKTFCAHLCMEAYKKLYNNTPKFIVLAPVIVLGTWMRETKAFTSLRPFKYKGTAEQRLRLREQLMDEYDSWDVLVTNYETLVPPSQDFTKAGLVNWWLGLSDERRDVLCHHYVSKQYVPADAPERINRIVYRNDIPMKKWESEVFKVLKKVPPASLLTHDLMREQRKLDDNTFLRTLPADALILDEGSRVKGHASQRSIQVMTLSAPIERRYVLSGTLCLGNPTDVYMPMTILNDKIFGTSYKQFEKKYCVYSRYNKHIIEEFKNLDQLKAKMDPYVISMKREDCLSLPSRIIDQRYYELSPEQMRFYDDIVLDKFVTVGDQEVDVSITIVKINKLRQVLSGHFILPLPRNDKICNDCGIVDECVKNDIYPWERQCIMYDPDNPVPKPKKTILTLPNPKIAFLIEDLELTAEKTIVWAYYQYDLEVIKQALTSKKIKFITADEEDCDLKFETDDSYKVFLGQVSQGIGITLNSATCTIYYSHDLALEPRLQSIDRNLRIGQTKKVWVKDYMAEGAVDETAVALLRHKEDVKDFIQSKGTCVLCEGLGACMEKGIEPYTEDCALVNVRYNAETKKRIKLKTFYEYETDEEGNRYATI